jgi:predicted extracellular nuclease
MERTPSQRDYLRCGRVTPVGNAAPYYQNDTNRPSLAQTFAGGRVSADTQTFTAVVNHFRSKAARCGQ